MAYLKIEEGIPVTRLEIGIIYKLIKRTNHDYIDMAMCIDTPSGVDVVSLDTGESILDFKVENELLENILQEYHVLQFDGKLILTNDKK